MAETDSSREESADSAKPTATCSGCGAEREKTTTDDVGCIVCLLRVGLDDGAGPTETERVQSADRFGTFAIALRADGSAWELGRGTMGITFRAIDTSLNRAVALKIIETNDAGDTGIAGARFMREARAAAALRHENIATVYQFGIREETGQCFYAMELIEGETLEDRVRRTGPLKWPAVVVIAQQVAAALVAAEEHGLIHRDLKPANLMLAPTETGLVKIIDFGLAKTIKGASDPMSLTQGGFVGTPAFASPEQFRDGPLDVRSDIYSLGATLWFALTGKTPLGGRSLDEIRHAQGLRLFPVEQLKAAQAPAGLISLLLAMLAFEPASRPTTQNLLVRLRRLRARADFFGKKSRLVLAVGLLFLTGAFAFLGLRWSHPQSQSMEKGETGAGSTRDAGAREAYLKGSYFWNKRTEEGCQEAEKYFTRALALDPNYARAYAGLADACLFLAAGDVRTRKNYFARSRSASRKALELDPTSAEAHASLGLLAMNYDWDWPAAEREFRQAIALNPDYATGHHWYAECLVALGRFDEGLREIERARELEPLSLIINTDVGKMLFYARRIDAAKKQLTETLKMDPNFAEAHVYLGWVYAERKELDEAITEFQEAARLSGNQRGALGYVGYVYGRMGKQKEAERMLGPLKLLYACIGLGDKDCAFARLEEECKSRGTSMTSLKVAPFYDSLRSDPRFADLLQRVHLAP